MASRILISAETIKLPASRASPDFQGDLLVLIPLLRAFSRSLCRNRDVADDMMQEALAKAWRARDRFEPGTNLKAWLFTILRHEFYSHARRASRQAPWDEERSQLIPAPPKEQEWTMDLLDTARALEVLPEKQRDSIILVAAGGFSYSDAGKICGAPEGSVKSRVARGRTLLSGFLAGERPLPPRSAVHTRTGFEAVLSQLTALMPSQTTQTASTSDLTASSLRLSAIRRSVP